MKCNSCGATVGDTAKFCEYCGTKLTLPVSELITEPVTETAAEPVSESVIEQTSDAPGDPVSEPVEEALVTAEPTGEHTAEAEAEAAQPTVEKTDTAREEAYLNYEKKLHEIRQQQTNAAVTAVPVAVTEIDTPTALEVSAPATGEESACAVDSEIISKQPNAAVLAGKSGIFAAANVLFTINTVLTALFSIVVPLLCAGGAVTAVAAISEHFGVDVSGLIELFAGETVVIALLVSLGAVILANLPNILINIGLCSTRSACKRSNGDSFRPTGLKLIRFITVIGIVLVSLILAAALCASVFFIIGDPTTRAMGITALTLTAVTTVVLVFCYAKIMSTLNNAIHTAEGRCEKKASTFLGVLCIIVAVFSLANIIACLALIFYAVTLFKYNAIINNRNAG